MHPTSINVQPPRYYNEAARGLGRWALGLVAALLALASTACGDGNDDVFVFAAASLRDGLVPIGNEYQTIHNVNIRFSFGGSVTLARQIERDAPADLFISAGEDPMDTLEERGLLAPDTRAPLLGNALVLVAPSGKVPQAQSLAETLAGADRIAMADPQLSPAGRYAEEALRSLGLWDDLKSRLIFGGDVRIALVYVESGNADLGLVYRSDVALREDVNVVASVPAHLHRPIIYPGAVIDASNQKQSAMAFLAFLQEEAPQDRLQELGFSPTESP
jgi:molybdate transport system substrate-binding protein